MISKSESASPKAVARAWYEVADVHLVSSPGLLVYRDRVENNLRQMIRIAGGIERLRPHIKTHKMRELVEMQLRLGITRFKCATVPEAEMAAAAGASDVLLAYQPVGPAVHRITKLKSQFPKVKFSVICDDAEAIRELSRAIQPSPASAENRPRGSKNRPLRAAELEVLLDLDVGQHRTGAPPDAKAVELYRLMASSPGLKPGGLHAYDGHLTESDVVKRTAACEAAFKPVEKLRLELEALGLAVPRVVAGGTPTFPIHARRSNVECSPGTCVFWDAGYETKFPDLGFIPAALVLTRVVSKPRTNRLCLDLGHKALASEMPPPRVRFLDLEDARAVLHSEEHLVVETEHASRWNVGDCLYGIPWHICPTVALYSEAMIIERGDVVGRWRIPARERRLNV